MKKLLFAAVLLTASAACTPNRAQQLPVEFNHDPQSRKIEVLVGGSRLTDYLYSPELPKQVLYPVLTASGSEITRGYPYKPRPYERIDHYHHAGVWFNFGDVNGLDFWNNSPRIDSAKRARYGSVVFRELTAIDPAAGSFTARADWVDAAGDVLLEETATYRFGGRADGTRTVERITILKAASDVTISGHKEGLFAIRLGLPLEEQSNKKAVRLDADGHESGEPVAVPDGAVTGRYRNADGAVGEKNVWGKRSAWVALRGEVDGEPVTVAIIDHPDNYGYPAWSHARGYGLFSTNNLAGRAVGDDQPDVKIVLKPGDTITFRHLLVIGGDLSDEAIAKLAKFN